MAIISAAADALSTGLMAASEMGWLNSIDTDSIVVFIQLMVLVGKCGQDNSSRRRKKVEHYLLHNRVEVYRPKLKL